jgi:hypothetical protein
MRYKAYSFMAMFPASETQAEALSKAIDKLEAIRDELFGLQRSLENLEQITKAPPGKKTEKGIRF